MESLLWPGRLLGLLGLLLLATVAWATAGFLRNVLAGLLLRGCRLVRPDDDLAVDGLGGRVESLGLVFTHLVTGDGGRLVVPNHRLVDRPFVVAARRPLATAQGDGAAGDAGPPPPEPLDPQAPLAELEAAHARCREAIAGLVDLPAGTDRTLVAQRQAALLRRLVQIETLIADRRQTDR